MPAMQLTTDPGDAGATAAKGPVLGKPHLLLHALGGVVASDNGLVVQAVAVKSGLGGAEHTTYIARVLD